ncbi:MAG TPA: methyltransferase domain-containing protein [Solirubrobacteraceae bacterium]|nr:methyltransferase domain-containing protein [Solirubrobacteraceae bacterium]
MKPKTLDWLVCPICKGDLVTEPAAGRDTAIDDGFVRCPTGHVFPIVDGVPRLLGSGDAATAEDARSIRESFSREWQHFDYERDRAWGLPVEQRQQDFLRQVDLAPEELEGRLVLDAGCGVGVLSQAISAFGCDVLAADIGRQVADAHAWYAERGTGRTEYIQADLMQPPFRPGTFDVIFCGGVLHHTPDTRATFEQLLPALKPGGTVFVWLYHHHPSRVVNLKLGLRRYITRLPAPAKHALVRALLPQAMLRQEIRARRPGADPADRLSRRERLITMLDSFTPRYRWEHTPEELQGWYREHGFVEIQTTELVEWGFGVVARRPAEQPAPSDEHAVTAEPAL